MWMKGHTCSLTLAVLINNASLVLINESIPNDDDVATFDVWLHQATLAADFNTA
jgi:hypothetical protein